MTHQHSFIIMSIGLEEKKKILNKIKKVVAAKQKNILFSRQLNVGGCCNTSNFNFNSNFNSNFKYQIKTYLNNSVMKCNTLYAFQLTNQQQKQQQTNRNTMWKILWVSLLSLLYLYVEWEFIFFYCDLKKALNLDTKAKLIKIQIIVVFV